MQAYSSRLASFTPPPRSKSSKSPPDLRWPHPNTYLATPATLAAAGFFFDPSEAMPDAVSCFLCDKGLADWDPDDDPAQIHADKCPKCPWVILKCLSDADDHGRFTFPSSSARLPTSRAMEKARLSTFGAAAKKWWPHKTPSPKTMANAGFIYTPANSKDDSCVCIYCGIELGGWQPEDDPMEEHRSRQAKNGHCPFFTPPNDTTSHPRPRTKSKAPAPTTPAPFDEDDEDEYQPPGTRSTHASTSSKKPGSSAKSSSKSKAKSSAKSSSKPKAKAIEEEVIGDYQIALNDDEDAPPKPRPKPRRASSRSTSRSSSRSRSRSRAPPDDLSDEKTEHASSSTKKNKSKAKSTSSTKLSSESEETRRSTRSRSRPPPDEDDPNLGSTHASEPDSEPQPRSNPAKSSKTSKGKVKASLDDVDEEPVAQPPRKAKPQQASSKAKVEVPQSRKDPPTDVSQSNHAQPKPTSTALPQPNGIYHAPAAPQTNGIQHAPAAPTQHVRTPFRSFQSPEDEEFAREEEALEEQARELMRADATLEFVTPSTGKGKGKAKALQEDSTAGLSSDGRKGPPPVGKPEMRQGDNVMDIDQAALPTPSTPPPPSTTKATLPTTVKFPHIVPNDTLMSLTDAERAMTVEQWVRHEMERQYEQLRSDGRQKIDAFKARAAEVAKQIEDL